MSKKVKIILIIGFIFLTGVALVSAYFITRQNTDVRNKAAIEENVSISFKLPTQTINGTTPFAVDVMLDRNSTNDLFRVSAGTIEIQYPQDLFVLDIEATRNNQSADCRQLDVVISATPFGNNTVRLAKGVKPELDPQSYPGKDAFCFGTLVFKLRQDMSPLNEVFKFSQTNTLIVGRNMSTNKTMSFLPQYVAPTEHKVVRELPPITVTITPTGTCPLKSKGDADCDNDVDLVDFDIFLIDFKDSAKNIQRTFKADFNVDGKVNLIDFDFFIKGFKELRVTATPAITVTKPTVSIPTVTIDPPI